MKYDEEINLHKQPITFNQYLSLSEDERMSENIYFINDIISDSELIQKLIDKITELQNELEQANLITKE